MKYATPLFVVFLFLSSCHAQEKEVTFHPIVLEAKETSLYTDSVDWKTVNTQFTALIKDKQGPEEMKEGLQYLVNALGDKHAAFRLAKDHSILVSYTGEQKSTSPLEREADFVNTVINDLTMGFAYELLEDKVGYLRVVGIGPGDVKAQADEIRNGLVALKAEGIERWIVDLRFNGGGNMEPMIAGLAPLLGEGKIGGAKDTNGEITREYLIENGQFNNFGRIVCEMENTPKIDSSEKVVVLLSRYTVSSGELVAVAFKGRENTRFIGEPTGGYTTGNSYSQINEELIMLISQDVFMDRNGNKYEQWVPVDEESAFQHTLKLEGDPQIEQAVAWLVEK